MAEIKNESLIGKRPPIITIVCIVQFLLFAFDFLVFTYAFLLPVGWRSSMLSSQLVQQVQQDYFRRTPISALGYILIIVGTIGYWKMRKWGVYSYSVWLIISIGVDILVGIPTDIPIHAIPIVVIGMGLAYLISIVVIGIGLAYFKRMT